MRVAVLEDDPDWAEIISQAIGREGWTMRWFRTGEALVRDFVAANFDFIVADVRLKEGNRNGIEIVRLLRDRGVATPALMLTLFADQHLPESGLEAGADDYLRKPFRQAELIQRMIAIDRRAALSDRDAIRNGPLRLSLQYRVAQYDGRKIRLGDQSFDILALLCTHIGQIVTPEMLWLHAWPNQARLAPIAANIQVGISRLREELREATDRKIVRTVNGRGYTVDRLS